ncbi:hypothetical protein ACOSP7_012763 [Xanthoceras sorbifolium]
MNVQRKREKKSKNSTGIYAFIFTFNSTILSFLVDDFSVFREARCEIQGEDARQGFHGCQEKKGHWGLKEIQEGQKELFK